MSVKGILFLCIITIYFVLVARLRGSMLDRAVVFLLRTLFVLGLCLLFYSPRMESVHREWKKPKFLILEDDSSSLKYQKDLEKMPSWLNELAKHGMVQERVFSASDAKTRFSIESQLEASSKNDDFRGIFLISDGQEILVSNRPSFKTPIFTVVRGKDVFADIHLSMNRFPSEAYLEQTIIFRGSIHRMNADLVQGTLLVSLNDEIIKEIPMTLNGEKTDFEFEHYFKSSGEKHFKVEFQSVLDEVILSNNQVEFFIDTLASRRLVYVMAPYPNPDLAFYLRRLKRDPSLEVEVCYLKSELRSRVKPSRMPTLVFFYAISYPQVEAFMNQPDYSKIPRIYVLGSDTALVRSYQDLNWLGGVEEQAIARERFKTWEYHLFGDQFLPLDLYEHEGYQQTVLSSFPLLKEFSQQFRPGIQFEVPLELVMGERRIPLIMIQKNANPSQVVINTFDLSAIPFSSYARERNLDFFERLVGNLVEWCIDSTNLAGVEIQIPAANLLEGELFKAKVQSDRKVEIELSRRSGEIIDAGIGTKTISRTLDFGNYVLVISEGQKILKKIPIHVGFGLKEFQGAGVNRENLREISDRSGGKFLDFPIQSLPSALGTSILEKKLELKRESVDLQKKLVYALALMILLGLEWIYRYSRRMI